VFHIFHIPQAAITDFGYSWIGQTTSFVHCGFVPNVAAQRYGRIDVFVFDAIMMSRFLVKSGHTFARSTSVSLLAVVLWQAVGYLRRRAIVHIQISHGLLFVAVLQDAPRVPSSVALNRDHSIVYAVCRFTHTASSC
jgi:hypothetical protein